MVCIPFNRKHSDEKNWDVILVQKHKITKKQRVVRWVLWVDMNILPHIWEKFIKLALEDKLDNISWMKSRVFSNNTSCIVFYAFSADNTHIMLCSEEIMKHLKGYTNYRISCKVGDKKRVYK